MSITTVTNTEWGVSYTIGYRADTLVELNVYRIDQDVPNEFGGRGVVIRHPDYHGLTFPTKEDAKAFCLDVGLIRPWVRTPRP